MTNAVAVAAWYIHTCALLDSKDVVCWGYGDGRLGQKGTGLQKSAPMVFP